MSQRNEIIRMPFLFLKSILTSFKRSPSKNVGGVIEIDYNTVRTIRAAIFYLLFIVVFLLFFENYMLPFMMSDEFAQGALFFIWLLSDFSHLGEFLKENAYPIIAYGMIIAVVLYTFDRFIYHLIFPSLTFYNYKDGKLIKQENEGTVYWIDRPDSRWLKLISKILKKKIIVKNRPFGDYSVIYVKRSIFPLIDLERKIVKGKIYRKGMYTIVAEGGIKRRTTIDDEEYGEVTDEVLKSIPVNHDWHKGELEEIMKKHYDIARFGVNINPDIAEEQVRNKMFLLDTSVLQRTQYTKEEPVKPHPAFDSLKRMIESYRDLGDDPDVSRDLRSAKFYAIVNIVDLFKIEGYRFPDLVDFVTPEQLKTKQIELGQMDAYISAVELALEKKMDKHLDIDTGEEDEWE